MVVLINYMTFVTFSLHRGKAPLLLRVHQSTLVSPEENNASSILVLNEVSNYTLRNVHYSSALEEFGDNFLVSVLYSIHFCFIP